MRGPFKTAYVASRVIVSNIPDLVSIALYLLIKVSLKKQVQPNNSDQSPSMHSVMQCQDVYVIPNRQIEQIHGDRNQDEVIRDVEPSGLPKPIEAWSNMRNYNTSPVPSLSHTQKAKNEGAVAMALEMHVSSALFDVLVPLLSLVPVDQRLSIWIPLTIFMTSWWPTILIFRTHSMLRRMVKEEVSESIENIPNVFFRFKIMY